MAEIGNNVERLGVSESGDIRLTFNEDNNINEMYLTFGLSTEEYGIGIGFVTEIVGMQKIMEVPDVPHFIKGVINLRGKVIPVMDVRSRFNMEQIPYTERTVIIVLDVDSAPIGLVVDNVREVMEISEDSIDKPPQFGAGREATSVISGLGRQGNRVAILLDIKQLVSDQAVNINDSLRSIREAS